MCGRARGGVGWGGTGEGGGSRSEALGSIHGSASGSASESGHVARGAEGARGRTGTGTRETLESPEAVVGIHPYQRVVAVLSQSRRADWGNRNRASAFVLEGSRSLAL